MMFWITACSADKNGAENSSSPSTETASRQETTPPPDQIDPEILKTRSFRESPVLAEKVSRGELPPLDVRLPEHPLVIKPMDTIGVYGGELRLSLAGDVIERNATGRILNENLMKFERPMARRIILNLAESYEFSNGNCTAVFHIRKGVKWSDGVPLTADDYVFWHDDIMFNDDARDDPFPPSEWLVDGERIEMKKIDDLTLQIDSPRPLARILFALCHDDNALPKHYLTEHHPKYNPEATYEELQSYTDASNRIMRPGMPRLSAWAPEQWVRGQRLIYERNPYYWKVDTAGNQLPYLDRLIFSVIPDPSVQLLKFTNEEIDFLIKRTKAADFEMLKANERKGGVRINLAGPNTGPVFYLNWDAKNPALREAFRNRKVRIALSHGINREEISELAYHGLLRPTGFSFFPDNPYHSDESLKRFSQYDPARARALFDEAGYVDSDGDGIRELRDGSPFAFTVDVAFGNENADVCELVTEYWKEIGVKMNLFVGLSETIYDRRVNGDFEVHIWVLDGAAEPLDVPHQWGIWKGKGPFWYRNAADDPPPWLAEVSELLKVAMTTLDPDKLRVVMERIRDLETENIPAIGVGPAYNIWGQNLRIGNVPRKINWDNAYRGPEHSFFFEQLFVRP